MTDAIFQNASHALHVSYLIHSLPATTKSPTAIVIDQLVKQNHVWDGVPVRDAAKVNFSGLSPIEVRAQCAQVVSMVNHLAHPAERAACEAVYGLQVLKANGVRGMSAYCAPALQMDEEPLLYIAWHVFARAHQREGITHAAIAEQFGMTLQAVRYASDTVKKYGKHLHDRALEALHQRFLVGGLICDF